MSTTTAPTARLLPVEQTPEHVFDRFKLEWIHPMTGRLRVSYFGTQAGLDRLVARHDLVVAIAPCGFGCGGVVTDWETDVCDSCERHVMKQSQP